jgi:hypothetical protein
VQQGGNGLVVCVGKYLVRDLDPQEGMLLGVPGVDQALDGVLQVGYATEHAAADCLAVMIENQVSTWFTQPALAGVKCGCTRE